MMSQIQLFNYDDLSPEVKAQAVAATERIKLRMKRTAEDIIEIGKDLIAIKAALPHGQFLPWINAEFEMSKDTAQNFIRVAEKFGDKNGKFPFFKPSVLYQLAAPSTPDEVVEKAIEKVEAGESLTVKEIKQLKAESAAKDKAIAKLEADQLKLEQRTQDLAMVVNAEREKLKKAEDEKRQAIADALSKKQIEFEQEMQQLQSELMRDIEEKSAAIDKAESRLEWFKKNPDPATKKLIKELEGKLFQLRADERKAETRLNELRTQESHAKSVGIQFARFKGAVEKLVSDHSQGLVAISSPYMSPAMLSEAETLAAFLEDTAYRIRDSVEASAKAQKTEKTVNVEVVG